MLTLDTDSSTPALPDGWTWKTHDRSPQDGVFVVDPRGMYRAQARPQAPDAWCVETYGAAAAPTTLPTRAQALASLAERAQRIVALAGEGDRNARVLRASMVVADGPTARKLIESFLMEGLIAKASYVVEDAVRVERGHLYEHRQVRIDMLTTLDRWDGLQRRVIDASPIGVPNLQAWMPMFVLAGEQGHIAGNVGTAFPPEDMP